MTIRVVLAVLALFLMADTCAGPADPGEGSGGGNNGGEDGGGNNGGGDNGGGDTEEARTVRAKADVTTLAQAVARERTDTGSGTDACLADLDNLTSTGCPSGCGTLPECAVATPGDICWDGPYLAQLMVDPWSHPYTAIVDPGSYAVTVMSNGHDGVANTDDDVTATE